MMLQRARLHCQMTTLNPLAKTRKWAEKAGQDSEKQPIGLQWIMRRRSAALKTDLTGCVEPGLKSSPQWITDARLEAVFCRMDTAQRVW